MLSTSRRMREELVFRCERGCGDLRNHVARFETRIGRQKRGQRAERRIDEQRRTPFADVSNLGNRDGQGVGNQGDRLGVEVAARDHFARFRKDQWIVGDAVRFVDEHGRGITQRMQTRTEHLGHAPQAVRILNAPAVTVRLVDLAACNEAAQRGRDVALIAVAPYRVDTFVERVHAAECGFDRQRAGNERSGPADLRHRATRPARARWRLACRSAARVLPSRADRADRCRRVRAPPPPACDRRETSHRRRRSARRRVCASGARSPDAPTDPLAGITGNMSRSRHAASVSITDQRMPE